jgi:hypothetical protein
MSRENRVEKERLFEGVSSKDLRLKGCIVESKCRNEIAVNYLYWASFTLKCVL